MFNTRVTMQQRAAVKPFTPSRRPTTVVHAVSLSGLVDEIAKTNMKSELPQASVGDSVRMGVAVIEGNGRKRTQTLEGLIIAEHGSGINKTITFRRMFQGVGVELIVPVHSPTLQSVEVVKRGRVRRAKLFYLRDRTGKSARLKEIVNVKPSSQ